MTAMRARIETRQIQSGNAKLHAEAIGDSHAPCIILVMGAQASLMWWPDEFCAVAQRGSNVDWNDRGQAVKQLLEWGRVLGGTEQAFDEAAARALIEADFDRSGGLAHGTNHFRLKGGERWSARLPELQPPLHVLHGRLDPLFPMEHGRAIASAVPGATLVELPGGHGPDRAAWGPLIDVLT